MAGYWCIRRKLVRAHSFFMLAALGTSSLFLVSYLTYHFHAGSIRFQGEGWIRAVYFTILISHTILAASVVPLALVTLLQALRTRFDRHRRIARWTLPIWFYVSVTGVVIYFMLYHMTGST
jgi:uncharacterized membrane protein YozB (DUF420 family)